MRRIKKWRALLLSGLASLLLAGCMMTASVEDLYVLPKLPEEYQSLQAQIEAILTSGAEYAAPTAGSNLQPVQLVDLNGDGEEEALAFFRISGEEKKPLKIYIFRTAGDAYEQVAAIEGSGTTINSIRYVDMNGDGRREILVSWRVSTEMQALEVYTLEDLTTAMMYAPYARYTVADLDSDGIQELVVLRSDNTETGGSVADYYDYDASGKNLQLWSTAKLSMTVAELQGMQTGTLQGGEPAVFVTGVEAESRTITDILMYNQSELTNIVLNSATGVSTEICRSLSLQPTDINGDGVTEVPAPAELRSEDEETYWKIYWKSYRADGSAEQEAITYHNLSDSWYLMIPDDWDDHFTVRQKTISSTERATTFYSVSGRQIGDELLTIYTLTGSNRESQAARGGRTILSRQLSGTVHAVSYTSAYEEWRYFITPEEMVERFHAIVAQWSTGEN